MKFEEGDIYTIKKHDDYRELKNYKYIRLQRWDGRHWIVRFIKENDTDWIALTELKLLILVNAEAIVKADYHEIFEAKVMERDYDLHHKKG